MGAYATVIHVQALNTGRKITGTSKPSASQVVNYLDETGAVIDGILRQQGYALPIASSATSALELLEHYNALGAGAYVEQAAPSSDDRYKQAMRTWESALKMLREGAMELDAAKDSAQSLPRANAVASPYFERDMDF